MLYNIIWQHNVCYSAIQNTGIIVNLRHVFLPTLAIVGICFVIVFMSIIVFYVLFGFSSCINFYTYKYNTTNNATTITMWQIEQYLHMTMLMMMMIDDTILLYKNVIQMFINVFELLFHSRAVHNLKCRNLF